MPKNLRKAYNTLTIFLISVAVALTLWLVSRHSSGIVYEFTSHATYQALFAVAFMGFNTFKKCRKLLSESVAQ